MARAILILIGMGLAGQAMAQSLDSYQNRQTLSDQRLESQIQNQQQQMRLDQQSYELRNRANQNLNMQRQSQQNFQLRSTSPSVTGAPIR